MKIEIDVDIPEGYEYVRFGHAQIDEHYLNIQEPNPKPMKWDGYYGSQSPGKFAIVCKSSRPPKRGDEGREIEVDFRGNGVWEKRRFVGLMANGYVAYEPPSHSGQSLYCLPANQTRIVDE